MEKTLSGRDIISNLPDVLIETILRKVPIKDAVKTCVLSKKWKYHWSSLTELVFDHDCVDHSDETKHVRLIRGCRLGLQGPIHKFALCTSEMEMFPNDEIAQWLLFLSTKDVKELSLKLHFVMVPPSIFSCQKLTSLELSLCELLAPPEPNIFPCLKYLHLCSVIVRPEFIKTGCPLLEKLTLTHMDLPLKFCSQNLKYLEITEQFVVDNMCLEYTPLLAVIIVDMVVVEAFHDFLDFDKFLGAVPRLERLEGNITKVWRIADDLQEAPIRYDYLKLIDLKCVWFEDLGETLVLHHLILNSPNVEELRISVGRSATIEACDLGFWENEFPTDAPVKQLKTVKMARFSILPHEIEFLQFLLRSSPVLEVMRIICTKPNKVVTELLQYQKASPKAQIIIST